MFGFGWHIELLCAKLAALRAGKIGRLIINVPPRYLKSHLVSVTFPAWCLGHQPSAQILCASYAQELADKLSRDCRRIIMSDWYRRVFPTRLSPERQAVSSRLNDKRRGGIVLVMHRLHEDDLVGHVVAQEDWEVVCPPVIAEEDETQTVDTVWGPKRLTRRQGEALHSAREPLPMLEQIRRTIGEYNFAGQYQQVPAPLGGGLVKAAWFRHYATKEVPQFERIVQSWDTASKATELSDYSVCTSWGMRARTFISSTYCASAWSMPR